MEVITENPNLEEDMHTQIAQLRAKLQHLRSSQVTELQLELKAARHAIAELENSLATMPNHELHHPLRTQFQALSDGVSRCYFITMALKQY